MMKEIELLETELKSILENIDRVKKYKYENREYKPFNCNVYGELKHRLVALRSRISIINKTSTRDLFN